MVTERGYKKQRNTHGETAAITRKVTILTNLLLPHAIQLVNDSSPLQGELLAFLLR